MRLAPLLALTVLTSGCAVPYFANLAQSFGGALTSPATDVGAMLRSIPVLCRRQADLAYLRGRIEDPADKKMVPWHERLTSNYSGRKASIEARCAELEKEVSVYQMMHATLLAYGSTLRALADTESTDFRDSFQQVGDSMGKVALRVRPDEPELGRALSDGADAMNQLLRLALTARSEADIKRAILAAAVPVRQLLDRLERAKEVYRDQAIQYSGVSQTLLRQIERATMPRRQGAPGRSFDVLAFYDLAQRMDEDQQKLKQNTQVYLLTLSNLRQAHEAMVAAAKGRVTAKQAFTSMQRNLRDLYRDIGDISDQIDSINRRWGP